MTKEQQIEEMATQIKYMTGSYTSDAEDCASVLYEQMGYRKQVEGKWISCKNNSGYKCSNCGARIKNSAKFNGNHSWCHKCGAKMNGE